MAAKAAGMDGLFRNRFVQVILLSGLLLQIGIWVRNFAILLFVVDQTNGDSLAVSLISVAEFAPIFIFSFIGGTFADRWKPKRTMIWCDILSALSIFVVLLTMSVGSWKAVFFATLVSAILSQFSQPSGMRLFKLHVPEDKIQAGMSLYQTMFALFMILGPILGTFVYQEYGIRVAIGIMGIAFLLSAAVLLFLPKDPETELDSGLKTSLWDEMGAGFRYVLSRKLLTTLGACFVTAGLALGLIQPLGVFLITEQLGLDKENLKWLMTANGVAMIVGGAIAMGMSKKMSPQWMLAVGMAVSAISLAITGFSTMFWLTLAAQFLGGLVLPAIQIGINTVILQNTDSAFVGRVNGILSPMFMGAMVVTMSMSGVLKEVFSLIAMYEAAAVLFAAGILVLTPILKQPASAAVGQKV
ncbi:MFS transporter [Paenibacillus validus]|uniref:MFS transporter n=1 Tax=Paenibacillus validus TaxID=44253 RepID=A0A7X2Z9D4_9BACL|nr:MULTISPECIES: MFS transporter [Paenibacillus]MED4603930.1 MFS transporter [Paenibacillus validus]MED4609647.1 MFS transporter [Paenibacillus validus]MUG70770.1 MFS transporter [Paenibacillus validus]